MSSFAPRPRARAPRHRLDAPTLTEYATGGLLLAAPLLLVLLAWLTTGAAG